MGGGCLLTARVGVRSRVVVVFMDNGMIGTCTSLALQNGIDKYRRHQVGMAQLILGDSVITQVNTEGIRLPWHN